MEDDTDLAWPALLSWAVDTELLAPLGYARCFVRTDFNQKTGQVHALDYTTAVSLSNVCTLDLEVAAPRALAIASTPRLNPRGCLILEQGVCPQGRLVKPSICRDPSIHIP